MSIETNFRIPPKSKFRGLRLDPEIVDLIIELNKAGYFTLNSCAGHHSKGRGKMRGYIAFHHYDDKAGIIRILKAYGLTDIRIIDGVYGDTDKVTIHDGDWCIATLVSFAPIGQPRNFTRDDDWDQLDNERQLLLL